MTAGRDEARSPGEQHSMGWGCLAWGLWLREKPPTQVQRGQKVPTGEEPEPSHTAHGKQWQSQDLNTDGRPWVPAPTHSLPKGSMRAYLAADTPWPCVCWWEGQRLKATQVRAACCPPGPRHCHVLFSF